LSVKTPIGRKVRPKLLHRATSLIRVKPNDLVAAGIERVGRTVGAKDGLPLIAEGRTLAVTNVIWCTGYKHSFPWIDLPIFDQKGDLMHDKGAVPTLPGLYFVGLHFLYAMSSASFAGIARDAERIAKAVGLRVRDAATTEREEFSPMMDMIPEHFAAGGHESRKQDVHTISA
jgi:putative flavoprotein involved in K+ transport